MTCWLHDWLRRYYMTCRVTTSWLAVSPLHASQLAVVWHHNSLNRCLVTCKVAASSGAACWVMALQFAKSCDLVTHPPSLQSIWLLALYGRAVSLLSTNLKPCQEVWEVFSSWCRGAKGRKYKVKSLSSTKGNGLSFFLTWHLLFITFFASWLLPSLLGFISSCSCAVCFCEFSIRLLKSNIALEFGLLKCHLALAPKPSPWWQPWDAV